ncbi:MAG: sugar-binding domain-containing protein, partial [Verrucomicrobiota bacterium]
MHRQNDWENPLITGIGREAMHMLAGGFGNAKEAFETDRYGSRFFAMLNGDWQFHLAESPEQVPAEFQQDNFDASDWETIPVPGNWELQGHDRPIYTNIPYPFKPAQPPNTPPENPTGCYRTPFTIPNGWEQRETFLLFESVDSAFYVWINGEPVGYGQDSKLPSEFNITAHLRSGENLLAVQVMRWSDGSYLEDQDYWHLSGIQRDVIIYSKPKAHLRDLCVTTSFTDNHYRDAALHVRAYTNNLENPEAYSIEAELFDDDGEPVLHAPLEEVVSSSSPMYHGSNLERCSAFMAETVKAPNQWTPEAPHLYTMVVTLRNSDGKAVDWERARVGFRQVEIKNGVVLLNGRRLIVRGVNRHEFHHERGRALTRDDMIAEIRRIKQLNFNAVRTSHYPNSP